MERFLSRKTESVVAWIFFLSFTFYVGMTLTQIIDTVSDNQISSFTTFESSR